MRILLRELLCLKLEVSALAWLNLFHADAAGGTKTQPEGHHISLLTSRQL